MYIIHILHCGKCIEPSNLILSATSSIICIFLTPNDDGGPNGMPSGNPTTWDGLMAEYGTCAFGIPVASAIKIHNNKVVD